MFDVGDVIFIGILEGVGVVMDLWIFMKLGDKVCMEILKLGEIE